MIRTALLSALAFAAVVTPALAQDAQPQCYQSGAFFVIGQDRTETVGTDFIIKTLPKGSKTPACVFEATKADIQLNDQDEPFWYEAIAGTYLVLTRSTGPDGQIVIFDMSNGDKVIDTPSDDDITVADDTITYWERIDEGTAENCPDFADNTANGLGSQIAAETNFDVSSGKTSVTGQQRCSATQ